VPSDHLPCLFGDLKLLDPFDLAAVLPSACTFTARFAGELL